MKNLLFGLLILFSFVAAGSAQTDEDVKFDEFQNTGCDNHATRMDFFVSQLNNAPTSKGYVFVYDGKLSESVYDKNGKFVRDKYISSRTNDVKELIGYFKRQAEFRSFPANRMDVAKAGFREKFTIEFWIVPNGATPPRPTPTLTKLKHRKAKSYYPYGFCGEE